MDAGILSFDQADPLNVPVNLWLSPVGDDDNRSALRETYDLPDNHRWTLIAALYQPRKDRVCGLGFFASAVTRSELESLVRTHVAPLYEIAAKRVRGIASGTDDHLYFWQRRASDDEPVDQDVPTPTPAAPEENEK